MSPSISQSKYQGTGEDWCGAGSCGPSECRVHWTQRMVSDAPKEDSIHKDSIADMRIGTFIGTLASHDETISCVCGDADGKGFTLAIAFDSDAEDLRDFVKGRVDIE